MYFGIEDQRVETRTKTEIAETWTLFIGFFTLLFAACGFFFALIDGHPLVETTRTGARVGVLIAVIVGIQPVLETVFLSDNTKQSFLLAAIFMIIWVGCFKTLPVFFN